jgi:diacylglycerol kinase family enzyme
LATHLLVGNPTAQSGKNEERIQSALGLLRDAGLSAELLPTLPEGKTIDAVSDALNHNHGGIKVVIAMGGDGTFREVGAGLLKSQATAEVALGMLPTGTANDQGKSFGLDASPASLAKNVEVIARGNETRLDAGEITGGGIVEYFFDSAGWGLSARVLALRNKDRRVIAALGPLKEVYRDQAVYVGALVRTFLESYVVSDMITATAVLDGRTVDLGAVTDLIVKNTRIYAGAWVFDKTSRHDDGAFEVVPFRGKSEWLSKAIVDIEGNPLTEAMLNEIGVSHSQPLRAKVIDLSLQAPLGGAPLAAQLDGEEWRPHEKVSIRIIPRALRLIVP